MLLFRPPRLQGHAVWMRVVASSVLQARCLTLRVDKAAVSRVRQSTGLAIKQCHNALKKFNNDEVLAKAWLEEQAVQEGWARAEKLQGRAVSQCLTALICQENVGAIVKVNCETDFVCRNELFQELATSVAVAALELRKGVMSQNRSVNSLHYDDAHLREDVLLYDLLACRSPLREDENVQDSVTRVITQVGENIRISKATTVATSHSNLMKGYVHGGATGSMGRSRFGQLGSLVIVRPNSKLHLDNAEEFTTKLAQHVTGMKPLTIAGSHEDTGLLQQPYLFDNNKTVGTVAEEHDVDVIDFIRFG